ncbi:jg22790 [Pararge aegeria aegeria]|uniref:Jg22790 protein n=1 Tax=Pararge aegeria aegeria TaxID=348720 RepID=A0A8S4QGG5_9NEOP|nr:jg22790 [Pararge aegeria aegeria]
MAFTSKRSVGRPPTRRTSNVSLWAARFQRIVDSGTAGQKTYVQQWTSIGLSDDDEESRHIRLYPSRFMSCVKNNPP